MRTPVGTWRRDAPPRHERDAVPTQAAPNESVTPSHYYSHFGDELGATMGTCKHDLPVDRCGICRTQAPKPVIKSVDLPDYVDVVIVAGGPVGYGEYLKHAAYIGWANRPFKKECRWMAFYADGEIKREVPAIIHIETAVLFSQEEADRRSALEDPHQKTIGGLMTNLLRTGRRDHGKTFDVILLSAPKDSETQLLDRPILNDKESKAGRGIGISQGQWRYTSLEALNSGVRTTTALGL